MIKFIKKIFNSCGAICSLILPASLFEAANACLSHFYTGYISRQFAHIAPDVLFAYKAVQLHGCQYISIESGTTIDKGIRLTAWDSFNHNTFRPQIKIGSNCKIGTDAHITCINRISIGNNLLTGTNLYISDNNHGSSISSECSIPPIKRPLTTKGEVCIGNNVWIGNNVCILSNVTIGDGAVIAANSVVTSSVPEYCIAAGVPARIVKKII